jgi:DNA-binding NarL/FixJ family response regulator
MKSAERLEFAATVGALTHREREVALLICAGESNKAIGRALGLAEGTVKQHAHVIYAKLGVRSRYELGCMFQEF